MSTDIEIFGGPTFKGPLCKDCAEHIQRFHDLPKMGGRNTSPEVSPEDMPSILQTTKQDRVIEIGLYGFFAVVFCGVAWAAGAAIILIGGLFYDLDAVNNTYLPVLVGAPICAVGICVLLWMEKHGGVAKYEIEPNSRWDSSGRQGGAIGLGKTESCPLCGRNLGPKPLGQRVGTASDFFLECENAHEKIIYSALTAGWSTKSKDVAEQLTAKGMTMLRAGNSYVIVGK